MPVKDDLISYEKTSAGLKKLQGKIIQKLLLILPQIILPSKIHFQPPILLQLVPRPSSRQNDFGQNHSKAFNHFAPNYFAF